VVMRQYQVMPVQLREVLKVCQGCHILNLTAKQPVVLSPADQFCPVPLMKIKPLRVGQVNRLNRQDPTMDTPFLPSEQCSTLIYRWPQRKEGQ